MANNNINKKIGKATAWSSVTELMAKLVTPIVNIILARLLLPEAFGVVATITMVISFAEVFTDAGFQKYIIQHEFADDEELDKSTNVAFWTNLSLSAFAFVIIFLFRDKIAALVRSPELGIPISVASFLIILHAFSSIQVARYKRDLDFKTLFFVRIGMILIPLVVTVPLAVLLRNYWALLIGNLASQVFNAVVLTWKSKWKIKFFYSFALFKDMFSFTSWTLLESISIWLTSNIDIFIISQYLNEHSIGLYTTSMNTVGAYMSLITSAVVPVLFSTLSRYQNDEEAFQSTYYMFQRLTSVFVLPMGIGIFVVSDLITMIMLGEAWMEASGFIGWWGLTSALSIILGSFSSEVIRSKGKPLISLIIQLSQIAVLVPVLLVFKDFGFKALYIARSLVRVELMAALSIVLCTFFKFNFVKILKNISPAAISALIMGVFGYALKSVFEGIVWQFVVVFLCVIVYFVVLLTCFPKLRQELLATPYAQKALSVLKRKKKTEGGNQCEKC